jgi:hypothetical protein
MHGITTTDKSTSESFPNPLVFCVEPADCAGNMTSTAAMTTQCQNMLEEYWLLDCDVWFGRTLPRLRGKVLPPPSGLLYHNFAFLKWYFWQMILPLSVFFRRWQVSLPKSTLHKPRSLHLIHIPGNIMPSARDAHNSRIRFRIKG